ncbi:glycosyltransferase family 25 protein [Erwinia rhapontici]|uniref:glycosyltransferase family 25 protein n=1 Tax=Erwinia rhapontici TaxID=55212 RepID=UPI001D0DBC99|nr:glycosyltransferase family 25 protein [Erwinia rhapontici]UDQ80197.1 glycosyltransferase family 25 protein [Erwinia rhapontici]
MEKMKTFIINLPNSIDRKAFMQEQCHSLGLNFEFFNAVAGKDFTREEVIKHSRKLTEVRTPGELGCALSHIELYRKIVTDNIPVALILEDDVVLNEDISSVLSSIEKNITGREIILLNRAKQYLNREIYRFEKNAVYPVAEADLTCSYVITQDAAEALLTFLYPVWLVADRWSLIRQYGVAKVNCLIPEASFLNELAETSTISHRNQEDIVRDNEIAWQEIKARRPINVKIKDILWRFFYRHYYKVIKNDKVK